MKINVWKSEQNKVATEVQFPLYSSWIVSDSATIYNRVDADGSCITIKHDSGDYRDSFIAPSFELERKKIKLDPMDESYLKTVYGETDHEVRFIKLLNDMAAAVQVALTSVDSQS